MILSNHKLNLDRNSKSIRLKTSKNFMKHRKVLKICLTFEMRKIQYIGMLGTSFPIKMVSFLRSESHMLLRTTLDSIIPFICMCC